MKKIFGLTMRLFYFSLFAGTTSFFYACTPSAGNQGSQMPSAPILPVLLITALPATTYQEFSASLEGSNDIEIRPQVEGYIERIYVDEGAHVRKGQLLFRINPRPYEAQLNNAKASLAVAKANLANARINVSKLEPLVQNNVISDVQLKTAQAAYDAAVASVSQAQATLKNAEINLGFTVIKAPADGYIGRIPMKTGSLVNTSTVQPLTVLSEIRKVYAYFSLSETEFYQFKNQFPGNTIEEKIKRLPPVELVLADGSVYPEKGKVEMVEGQFDKTVGAISFRAVFPNSAGILRSGNTGRVKLPQNLQSALVVPQEATFEMQDKVFVYAVADSNKIVTKPITVNGRTSNYYYVSNGVKEGEKIVLSSQSTMMMGGLRDGMPITPQMISTDSLLKAKPL